MTQQSLKPRVVRKETPPQMRGRDGYLKAREHLRRDFDYRCAYCMIHEQQVGGIEGFSIDPFRPRSKSGCVNDYANLYWVCMGCNRSKGDTWPTSSEHRWGLRFADPCNEPGYGIHFVENKMEEGSPRMNSGINFLTYLR